MNRRTYGILAGLAGGAIGAWFWRRQSHRMRPHHNMHRRERGTVIFKNTPTAAPEAGA